MVVRKACAPAEAVQGRRRIQQAGPASYPLCQVSWPIAGWPEEHGQVPNPYLEACCIEVVDVLRTSQSNFACLPMTLARAVNVRPDAWNDTP